MIEELCQSKISNFNFIAIDQYIIRLDIPMHDTLFFQIDTALDNLLDE